MQQFLSPQPVDSLSLHEATNIVNRLFMQRNLVSSVTEVHIKSIEHRCVIISCTIISKSRNRMRIDVALIEEEGE